MTKIQPEPPNIVIPFDKKTLSVVPISTASGNSMTIRACIFVIGVLHLIRTVWYLFDPGRSLICLLFFYFPAHWTLWCARKDVDYKNAYQFQKIGTFNSYAFCAQWFIMYIVDTYVDHDESIQFNIFMHLIIAVVWACLCSGGWYIMKFAYETEKKNRPVDSDTVSV